MKQRCLIVLILLGGFGVGTAYADSDGYYCAGREYVAYQFGFAAPPIGPHRLYVVRFGGTSGIEAAAVLDLPQFQVHGILCGERTVEIAAYDAIYSVRLDAAKRPIGYDTTPWADHQSTPPQFVGHSLNLGALSRAARDLKVQRESLGTVDGGGQYLLAISAVAIPSDRCSSMVTTRLVRTDRNGHQVQQLEIFRGRAVHECGE